MGGALLFGLVWCWSLISNRLGAAWGHLSISYALASGACGIFDRTYACINNAYNIYTTTMYVCEFNQLYCISACAYRIMRVHEFMARAGLVRLKLPGSS